MASKYDPKTQGRVIRLFRERHSEAPEESATALFRCVHELLGIPIDTMRGWVRRAEVDAGERPGVTSSEHEELIASAARERGSEARERDSANCFCRFNVSVQQCLQSSCWRVVVKGLPGSG